VPAAVAADDGLQHRVEREQHGEHAVDRQWVRTEAGQGVERAH
jgi:hypothetical protein